jgi:hypothetical protein
MARRIAWAVAAILVAGAMARAQRPPVGAPRTPDGRPNLQGVWDLRPATPLERRKEFVGKAFFTPEEAAEFERREAQRIAGAVAVHAPGWLDYGPKRSTSTPVTKAITDW